MPKASVLMPVRNGEAFLADAVESIQSQSEKDFEFVIVDDGSTDATAETIERFARKDPRIRLIRQQASGLVASLNHGLSECRAPFVARMDADDIAMPNRLEVQLSYLRNNPGCVATGSSIILMSQQGETLRKVDYPTGEELLQALEAGSALAHPSVMFRRDSVLQAGGYRGAFRHAEDYDLWLRLLEIGELANIPIPLLKYRQHPGQVSVLHSVDQATSTELARQLRAFRKDSRQEPPRDWSVPLNEEELLSLELPAIAIASIILVRLHRLVLSGASDAHSIKLLSWIATSGREVLSNIRGQATMLRIARAAIKARRIEFARDALLLAFFASPIRFADALASLTVERFSLIR